MRTKEAPVSAASLLWETYPRPSVEAEPCKVDHRSGRRHAASQATWDAQVRIHLRPLAWGQLWAPSTELPLPVDSESLLFVLGVLGIFLNRKNVIIILMSIELMLLAVNINLVSF